MASRTFHTKFSNSLLLPGTDAFAPVSAVDKKPLAAAAVAVLVAAVDGGKIVAVAGTQPVWGSCYLHEI